MRAVHSMERRLQDLERKFQNKERLGKIVDVKYEKNRWYVKLNDGESQTPSGSEGNTDADKDTFKSDWLPWKSFSHGTIKMSVPPKKGQHALLRSVGGAPELATVEAFHYGPDNPSPHDKQDEVVSLVEDDDGDQNSQQQQSGQTEDKWNRWQIDTKDSQHLIIRKKDSQQTGSTTGGTSNQSSGQNQRKSRKIPVVGDDGDDKTTQVKVTKDYILKTVGKNKSYFKQDGDKINFRFGEKDKKGDVVLDDNTVTIKFGDKKAKVTWSDDNLVISFGDGVSITHDQQSIVVKGSSHVAVGVDGMWVNVTGDKVHLGVPGPDSIAENRVMTEAGPSEKVWAKI